METDVIEALETLGFDGLKLDESSIERILQDPVSFSKILAWISNEMKAITKLDEGIKPLAQANDDLVSFYMDLSSFLKELGCNYSSITEGNISERFSTTMQRLLVLTFLTSELQALRMIHIRKSKQMNGAMVKEESEQARLLREICQTLGLPKPPSTIDTKGLFAKIDERLTQIQSKIKPTSISYKPGFSGVLSQKQWDELKDLNKQLHREYELRRELLLTRLDVTIESFHWSDKLESKKQTMTDVYQEHRSKLSRAPNVTISDLLAARTDIFLNEKTSSGSAREHTKSAVNEFLIGKVPDRGGRPDEAVPPPPEMPPWQQRSGPPGPSGSVGWKPNPQRGGGGRGGPPPRRGGDNYQQRGRGRGGDYQQYADYQQYSDYEQGNYNRGGGESYYQHDQRNNYESQRGGSNYQRGGSNRGNYQQQRGDYRGSRGASRVQGGWSNY